MIQPYVPKDIRVYKTKIIGPLSLRQILCVAGATLLSIGLYQGILKPMNASSSTIIYTVMFASLPILAFMITINGLPFEKHLKYMIETMVTMLFYDRCIVKKKVREINEKDAKDKNQKKSKKIKKKKITKKELSEHPEFISYK